MAETIGPYPEPKILIFSGLPNSIFIILLKLAQDIMVTAVIIKADKIILERSFMAGTAISVKSGKNIGLA